MRKILTNSLLALSLGIFFTGCSSMKKCCSEKKECCSDKSECKDGKCDAKKNPTTAPVKK